MTEQPTSQVTENRPSMASDLPGCHCGGAYARQLLDGENHVAKCLQCGDVWGSWSDFVATLGSDSIDKQPDTVSGSTMLRRRWMCRCGGEFIAGGTAAPGHAICNKCDGQSTMWLRPENGDDYTFQPCTCCCGGQFSQRELTVASCSDCYRISQPPSINRDPQIKLDHMSKPDTVSGSTVADSLGLVDGQFEFQTSKGPIMVDLLLLGMRVEEIHKDHPLTHTTTADGDDQYSLNAGYLKALAAVLAEDLGYCTPTMASQLWNEYHTRNGTLKKNTDQ